MQATSFRYTWFRYFLQVSFIACMYFLLARMSLFLQFESSNATPVWPPAGFAFAMVLLWGYRVFPGILFGAFAANFLIFTANQTVDYPEAAWLSLMIAIGNTGEALVGNYLLKKWVRDFDIRTFPEKVHHFGWLTLVGGIMCLVSSIIGAFTDYMADLIPSSQVFIVWLTWWMGDCAGVLLVTTFILIWVKFFRNPKSDSPNKPINPLETLAFFITVVLSGGIMFLNWIFSITIFQWAYWIIPVLVLSAIRLTQREVISGIAIYSIMATIGTIHHHGPFGSVPLNEALLAVQGFIAIMVVTKLTLHASIAHQRKTEEILRAAGSELEKNVKARTAQLEEKNFFADTILNSSFDSIVVLDKETRCISINKIAKTHLRLPYPENVIGQKIFELPFFAIPETIRQDIMSALQGIVVHRDKFASPISERYFEIDYIPLKNHEGVYAIMIVGHDITQRIHAESELKEQKAFAESLIEHSPYMIMAYDTDLHITAWNKKSEEFTGLTKEQAIGSHTLELFPQYNTDHWKNTFDKVLIDGQSLHFPKLQFLNSSGWGESFITPLRNSKSEITGLLTITREITDIVNLTSRLEENNKDLLKSNEELSSFAYVASHDFQEPLRKIQIFANRILEGEYDVLSSQGKDFFDRMKQAASRMQALIEDLLMYSRTSALTRNFETVDLKDVVDEVRENLKDEIAQRNATFIADDLCDCHVIPFQMKQLMYNLITNSLKFSKPDVPPRIVIKSTVDTGKNIGDITLDPETKYCHISVEDNGIGFDPAFREQIFGLFQRLHGKNEYPGTGIGLSICKKIVENHGGIITADGVPGKGATFNIFIPHMEEEKVVV